jgi:hypothetical protein
MLQRVIARVDVLNDATKILVIKNMVFFITIRLLRSLRI